MPVFRPAREILTLIGASTCDTLPTGFAQTFPCPARADTSAPLRCVFYEESGPPERRVVDPPSYVIDVDGTLGAVVRFAPCAPAEVGAAPPLVPVPGAGVDPTAPVMDFVRRRERVYDLAPAVWEAYVTHADASIAPTAGEFLSLLLSITKAEVAPFQVGATPEFFRWLWFVTGR